MTVYSVVFLSKIPYIHRIYRVLVNPRCTPYMYGSGQPYTWGTPRFLLITWGCTEMQAQASLAVRQIIPSSKRKIVQGSGWPEPHKYRVGQNRIYTPYMTVYLVISLPKTPYMHCIYMWLWPTLYIYIYNACTVFLTGKPPNMRSYTV